MINLENLRIIRNLEGTTMPTENEDLMLHYLRKSYDDNFKLIHHSLFSNDYFVSSLIEIISNNKHYTHSSCNRFIELAKKIPENIDGYIEINTRILIDLCFHISDSSGFNFVGMYFSMIDSKFNDLLEEIDFVDRYIKSNIVSMESLTGKNYDDLIKQKYREKTLTKKLDEIKQDEALIKTKKKI